MEKITTISEINQFCEKLIMANIEIPQGIDIVATLGRNEFNSIPIEYNKIHLCSNVKYNVSNGYQVSIKKEK